MEPPAGHARELDLDRVAGAIHAYPTFSESVKGALLGIDEQVG